MSTAPPPAWLRELALFLPLTSQFVISGNIHDLHLADSADSDFRSTVNAIEDTLGAVGYDLIYRFDSLEGISLDHVSEGVDSDAFFPPTHLHRPTVGSVAKLADLMLQSLAHPHLRVALIVQSAAALWNDPDNVEARRLLLVAQRIAALPAQSAAASTIVWLTDADNDAPDWLRRADSTRVLRVPRPALTLRRAAASTLIDRAVGAAELDPAARRSAINLFAESTQGVTLQGMVNIITLAGEQGIRAEQLDEAARSYLAGVVDSPWQDALLRERIREASTTIQRRVLGQPAAIQRALDILLRSAMGLTGAHLGRLGGRPQGILFFAGPTGVGKTELAKALAGVMFGAEDAYTRFDMSEFSAEHSEARLIGAPPGYIGHREGGELTRAVRERPFSVILFDEVEKAHPRILDKFLQILDDGRLTDGSGNTVYFSESVVIFTSNLGANADRAFAEESHQERVLRVIQQHFTDTLGRPELLSRIGDNIIVFEPIGSEVGSQLAKGYIDTVVERVLLRTGIRVTISDDARAALLDYALTLLPFGGRGVGTAIETALVNPLARALDTLTSAEVTVTAARHTAQGWMLELS